jgi:hypothetical protein
MDIKERGVKNINWWALLGAVISLGSKKGK